MCYIPMVINFLGKLQNKGKNMKEIINILAEQIRKKNERIKELTYQFMAENPTADMYDLARFMYNKGERDTIEKF